MRSRWSVSLACSLALLAPVTTRAACHPHGEAPGAFRNPPKWDHDSGIVTDRFVDLRGPGGLYRVAHGVDVSHWNRVKYDELARCDAAFAFVKLDEVASFVNHSRQFQLQHIPVMPYFYLSMPDEYKYNPGAIGDDQALNGKYEEFRVKAEASASASLNHYSEVTRGSSAVLGGISGHIIALDVEEAIDVTTGPAVRWRRAHGLPNVSESQISDAVRVRYSKLYASMVASWIRKVTTDKTNIVLFYTYPDMFASYLINARRVDFDTIHGLPVWLANNRPHGDEPNWADPTNETELEKLKGAQRMCLSVSGGNKCVIHQYTSRGIFGVQPEVIRGNPAHLDLDRLFPIATVGDRAGTQYVRKVEYQAGPVP